MSELSYQEKLDEILHKLLGEWGSSPAFEQDQVARAKQAIEAIIKDEVERAKLHEHTLLQHQGTNVLKSLKGLLGWSQLRVEQLKESEKVEL